MAQSQSQKGKFTIKTENRRKKNFLNSIFHVKISTNLTIIFEL